MGPSDAAGDTPERAEATRPPGPSVAPTLDYSNPRHPVAVKKLRLPNSVKAAALMLAACAAGVWIGPGHGPGVFLVPVVWVAGGWYCISRVLESNVLPLTKGIVGCAVLVIVMVAPVVLIGEAGVPLAHAIEFGWNSAYVTDRERTCALLAGACIAVIAIAQTLDWLKRRSIRRRMPQVPHVRRTTEQSRVELRTWLKEWSATIRWRPKAIIAALVLLTLAAIRYVPEIRWSWKMHQMQLAAQPVCMSYVDLEDTVVFSSDPVIAQQFVGSPQYLVWDYGGGPTVSRHMPICWFEFTKQSMHDSVIFLHRLNFSGTERLVAMRIHADPVGNTVYLGESVYQPATRFRSAADVTVREGRPLYKTLLHFQKDDRVTFFAGQLNRSDPSAFTIDYVLNGIRSTIDGRFDGSSITLAPRPPSSDIGGEAE